jgi:protein-S-isoprenylcysteine O-methyltransferase Ste14
MFAMLLGTGLLLTRLVFLALAVAFFVTGTEVRVRIEDRLLASRFGETFAEYRRRVPAYIPFLR